MDFLRGMDYPEETGGRLRKTQARTVRQSELTEGCWLVQCFRVEHCLECEHRDTPDCGGEEIRRTGKNALGHSVPLGEEVNRCSS